MEKRVRCRPCPWRTGSVRQDCGQHGNNSHRGDRVQESKEDHPVPVLAGLQLLVQKYKKQAWMFVEIVKAWGLSIQGEGICSEVGKMGLGGPVFLTSSAESPDIVFL